MGTNLGQSQARRDRCSKECGARQRQASPPLTSTARLSCGSSRDCAARVDTPGVATLHATDHETGYPSPLSRRRRLTFPWDAATNRITKYFVSANMRFRAGPLEEHAPESVLSCGYRPVIVMTRRAGTYQRERLLKLGALLGAAVGATTCRAGSPSPSEFMPPL